MSRIPRSPVDRHWFLAAANRAVAPLLTGVDPGLLRPPVNVMRLALHPSGLAPRTVNLAEWRAHLLERLRLQIEISGDPVLIDLLAELRGYDVPAGTNPHAAGPDFAAVAILFRLATDDGILSFISTTTVFGTPVDVTLSELALECFFPADQATVDAMRRLNAARSISPVNEVATGPVMST
jgi:hypothetical protein